MASRTMVFDHFCNPLVELDVPSTPRSWVLNKFAEMDFTISTADAKCTETNMQFGNLIHVDHIPTTSGGRLPGWTGIILPPRNWDEGMLHVTVYSAEAVLAFRAMPYVKVSGTPGTIFKQLLQLARQAAPNIVIQPGIVEDMQQQFSDDLRLSAYDHIQRLTSGAGMEWDVTGEVDEFGKLKLYGNLYIRKGVDTNMTLTNINSELGSPMLSEQGTPANHVFGYTDAWTPQSRFKVLGLNQDAIDDYGPLQTNHVFVGKHDENSVKAAAVNLAEALGRPVKKVRRSCMDFSDTFSYLETGNVVYVKGATVGFSPGGGFGFEGQARIISVDYNDLTNKTVLNLEYV